ncbi:MAG: hypothetical protein KGI84_03530 [Elusimicrobia bacterium]|nr:hypothetical protein [Elusimicrobiota bacterium]
MPQASTGLRRAATVAVAVLGASLSNAAAFPKAVSLEAVFSAQSFDGAGTAFLRFAPMPPARLPVPTAALVQQAAAAQEPPIVPDTLWAGLAPLTQDETALLYKALPQANPAQARRLSLAAAVLMVGQAVAKRYNTLELFTNPSWTENQLYFVDGPDVAQIMAKYAVDSMVPAEGIAQDGKPFHMLALIIGQGHLIMLMDRSNFRYTYAEDHGQSSNVVIVTSNVVRWTIHGPGDLQVSGLKCAHWLVDPTILEITQISPSQARVHTDWGDKVISISPIILNDKKNAKNPANQAASEGVKPIPNANVPLLPPSIAI